MEKTRKAPKFPKVNDFVLVKWEDSTTYTGWRATTLKTQPLLIVSVGWVIAVDPTKIALAHTLDNEGSVLAPMVIPGGSVREVQMLKADSWPAKKKETE